MNAEHSAIVATKRWVDDLVVGLNFCPFAKREIVQNRVRLTLVDCQVEDVIQGFLDELSHLDKSVETETTLLVLTNGYQHFSDYLDLVDSAESLLDGSGYRGLYQLATFHPHYCFEGELEESAANYTNRAPYPILHLLREASLSRALEKYPDPESIPQNNIDTCNKLGIETLKEQLLRCSSATPTSN